MISRKKGVGQEPTRHQGEESQGPITSKVVVEVTDLGEDNLEGQDLVESPAEARSWIGAVLRYQCSGGRWRSNKWFFSTGAGRPMP